MKIDSLKEKISNYRELYKILLVSILALITGIITLNYQILINKIPFFMIFFSGIGLIIAGFIVIVTIEIWKKMNALAKELENA
jgi:F0F1-type ATP synthase assembly protein I